MTNIRLPIEAYDDLEIKNLYQVRTAAGYAPEAVMESIYARGRDNARTPMQWSAEKWAGFSAVEPWLCVNPNYTQINAEQALQDKNSIFWFYQKLIALRKRYAAFRDGRFTLLCPEDESIFAYTRDTETEHMLVVCNFTDQTVPFSMPEEYQTAEKLVGNYEEITDCLKPYEAYMLYRKDI